MKLLILFLLVPLLTTDRSMILCYTLPLTPSSANARLGEDFTLNKTPEYLISIKKYYIHIQLTWSEAEGG